MGKIGLRSTDKLLLRQVEAAVSRKGELWAALEKDEIAYPAYRRAFDMLIAALAEVGRTNKVLVLLKAEQILVEYDSAHYCQTAGSKKRQRTILDQLSDLERLLRRGEATWSRWN